MDPNKKVFIILFISFIIRLVYSCCECNTSPLNFNIRSLKVTKIDNSGIYPQINPDSICRSAVAFEIILSEAQNNKEITYNTSFNGFTNTYATDCDCSILYKPDKTIDSISIISNYRIDFNNPPNSIVTDLFVASFTSLPDNLYTSISKIKDDFNHSVIFDEKEYLFYLYLTVPIETDIASFTFNVSFSDGTNIISAISDFYVKDCK